MHLHNSLYYILRVFFIFSIGFLNAKGNPSVFCLNNYKSNI